MKTRILLSVIATLFTLNFTGQIIHVPEDHAKIQDAINASHDGDTILVADGTYMENINYGGKAILVASNFLIDGNALHKLSTVIDGSSGSNPVVRFISGEDTTSILYGFTIRGGLGSATNVYGGERMGGGIFCYNSGAKISQNRIIDNSLTHVDIAAGAGIACVATEPGIWVIIEDNIIKSNTSEATGDGIWRSGAGGGMYILANAIVRGNKIQSNACFSTLSADGAGAEFESYGAFIYTVYFVNNVVEDNYAEGDNLALGGGLNSYSCRMFIEGNTFKNNFITSEAVATGGGVQISSAEGVEAKSDIINNEFMGNVVEGGVNAAGSALIVSNAQDKSIVRNNRFISNGENNSSTLGTLIVHQYWGRDTDIEIDGNVFRDNRAASGGAIYVNLHRNLQIHNNLFVNNIATEFNGGAITLAQQLEGKVKVATSPAYNNPNPLIANNTFVNNHAELNGGAIYCDYEPYAIVTFNNIFWENEANGLGNNIYNADVNPMVIAYSSIGEDNIDGLWEGRKNFSEDPMLLEDSTHIEFGSPCIDAGVINYEFDGYYYSAPQHDFEGEGRPTGDAVDVGADEFLSVGVVASSDNGHDALKVYPNPFSAYTNITIDIESESDCRLIIRDALGNEMEVLSNERLSEGQHEFKWDASIYPNGIFFLKLIKGDIVSTQKLLHTR